MPATPLGSEKCRSGSGPRTEIALLRLAVPVPNRHIAAGACWHVDVPVFHKGSCEFVSLYQGSRVISPPSANRDFATS